MMKFKNEIAHRKCSVVQVQAALTSVGWYEKMVSKNGENVRTLDSCTLEKQWCFLGFPEETIFP